MYVTSSLSLSVHLIQSQVIAQQVLGCFEDEDCCPVRYLMQLFAKLDYFQSVFITKCLFEQSLFFGSSDQLKNVRSSFKWSLTDGKWRSCFSKKIYVHFPQVIPISNTKIWRKVKLFRLKTIIILKKEKNDAKSKLRSFWVICFSSFWSSWSCLECISVMASQLQLSF